MTLSCCFSITCSLRSALFWGAKIQINLQSNWAYEEIGSQNTTSDALANSLSRSAPFALLSKHLQTVLPDITLAQREVSSFKQVLSSPKLMMLGHRDALWGCKPTSTNRGLLQQQHSPLSPDAGRWHYLTCPHYIKGRCKMRDQKKGQIVNPRLPRKSTVMLQPLKLHRRRQALH